MNGDEVLKLIEAGFTAEEIRKMDTAKATDEPAPESKTDETKPVEEGKVEPDINTDFMDSIKKSIDDLTTKVKAIQEDNLKNAKIEPTKDLTAADVVKSFIENT